MALLRNQGPWKASENRLRRLNSANVWFNPGSNLYSWGHNVYGELGLGDVIPRSTPTQISGSEWKQLGTQGGPTYAGLAIKNDDTLWGWGYNPYGALGLNDTLSRTTPTKSSIFGPWKKIGLSYYSAFGIKEDGTLWAWGYNYYGMLGQNDDINRSSPIQIPGTWSDLGLSYYANFAIKSDGTLWCLGGYNPYGNFGTNDIIPRSSPTQIGTRTDWKKVFNSRYYTMTAQTNDGSTYNWGYNGYTELGQNDAVPRSSPTLLLGQSGINLLDNGNYHNVAAVRPDGSLTTWGYNVSYGGMGVGDVIPRSNPLQIPGGEWMQPSCSHDTQVIKRDGTAWGWGYNTYGVYGNNVTSTPTRSSPIQMTSGWKSYNNIVSNNVDLHFSPMSVSTSHSRFALTDTIDI